MKLPIKFLSLAASSFIAAISPAQTANSLVTEARTAIQAKDYTTANDKLDAALAIDANHGDANALAALTSLATLADKPSTQQSLNPFGLQSSTNNGEIEITDPNLNFHSTADLVQWTYYRDAASDGTDALLSGSPPPEYSSNVSTTITGPGTLEFSWANFSPDWTTCRVSLLEDGNTVASLPAGSDWIPLQHDVPDGSHSYTWRFYNSNNWTNLDAYAGLDQVSFTPQGQPPTGPNIDDGSQTGFSLANALDNNSLTWSTQGSVRFDPTHNLNLTRDFVTNTFAAELEDASQHLEIAAKDANYTITLDSNETGSSVITADSGDLQLLASILHLQRSFILCLSVYNMDAQIGTIHEIDRSIYLDPQSLLAAYPDLFSLESLTQLPEAKAALFSAHSAYISASTFIRNRSTQDERLFDILDEQLTDEEEFRDTFTKIVAAAEAPQDINGETIDLSPLFVDGFDLNSVLPQFIFGSIVEGSFPDPTFQGILPLNSAEYLQAKLRESSKTRTLPLGNKLNPVLLDSRSFIATEAAEIVLGNVSDDGKLIAFNSIKDDIYSGYVYDVTNNQAIHLTSELLTKPPRRDSSIHLSGNGKYAFFSSNDSALLDGLANPPAIVTIANPGEFLQGEPFQGIEFTVDATPPNSGRYTPTIRLDLDFFWPVSQATSLKFEVESPHGEKEQFYRLLPQGDSTLKIERPLYKATDSSQWNGNWKLRLIESGGNRIGEAIIQNAELRLDAPPAQLFRKNIETGDIDIVTQSASGEISEHSFEITEHLCSSDGRYVTFSTRSNRLYEEFDNSNLISIVYRKDMLTGEVIPIDPSLVTTGGQPSISADGLEFTFISSYPYQEINDNNRSDVYHYDSTTDTYTILSSTKDGVLSQTTEYADHANSLISADGNTTIFRSNGMTLAYGIPMERRHSEYLLFAKNLTTKDLDIVDHPKGGGVQDLPRTSITIDQSSDGQFVVFASTKPNIVEGFQQDPNIYNVYLYDTQSQTASNLTNNEDEATPSPGISSDASIIAFTRGTELTILDRQSQSSKKISFEYLPDGYVSLEKSSFYLSESSAYASVKVIWNFTPEEPDSIEVDLATYRGNISTNAPQIAQNRTVTLTKTQPTTTIEIPIFQGFIKGNVGFTGIYIDAVRGSNIGPLDDCLIALTPSESQNAFHTYLSQFLPDGVETYAYDPLADLDEDGLVNYIEMLLGGNPLVNDATDVFKIVEDLNSGTVSLHIQVNTSIKVGVYLEISSDLNEHWKTIPIEELSTLDGVVVKEDQNGILSLKIDASSLPVTNAQFFRLKMDI